MNEIYNVANRYITYHCELCGSLCKNYHTPPTSNSNPFWTPTIAAKTINHMKTHKGNIHIDFHGITEEEWIKEER